mmetsp:Transcript_16680/g.37554  ORF Transcript_16680/g.37554 Transcript_16680/m.37554 type:complete len:394 (+) Transcript_16680:78-1259(+)
MLAPVIGRTFGGQLGHRVAFAVFALLLPVGLLLLHHIRVLLVEWHCVHSPERPLLPAQDVRGLETFHVAMSTTFSLDNFEGVLSVLVSFARHVADPGSCVVHIIAPGHDEPKVSELVQCWQRELELAGVQRLPRVQFHELRFLSPTAHLLPTQHGKIHRIGLVNPSTFVRLNLPDYLPDVRRVLWLDHDLVIKADLTPVYRMHMRKPVAATTEWCARESPQYLLPSLCPLAFYYVLCPDCVKRRIDEGTTIDWPRASRSNVFNTGVLLMDLDKWREDGLSERILDWVNTTNGLEGDQVALNIFLGGTDGIDELDFRWNMFLHHAQELENVLFPRACSDSARIVHFSGDCKPWTRWIDPANKDQSCITSALPHTRRVYHEWLKPTRLECPLLAR